MTTPTRRFQPTESAADIPRPGVREAQQVQGADSQEVIRQVVGALSALAGRVDRLDARVSDGLQPKVTRAERSQALEQARAFVAELSLSPRYERVHAELAVARYLTGE